VVPASSSGRANAPLAVFFVPVARRSPWAKTGLDYLGNFGRGVSRHGAARACLLCAALVAKRTLNARACLAFAVISAARLNWWHRLAVTKAAFCGDELACCGGVAGGAFFDTTAAYSRCLLRCALLPLRRRLSPSAGMPSLPLPRLPVAHGMPPVMLFRNGGRRSSACWTDVCPGGGSRSLIPPLRSGAWGDAMPAYGALQAGGRFGLLFYDGVRAYIAMPSLALLWTHGGRAVRVNLLSL